MTRERLYALRVLLRMQKDGGYSNIVLEQVLRASGLSGRQRAFCSALCYGVVERSITLDHILAHYLSRPLGKLDKEVLCILRMGAYQIFFMDGVPHAAAVSESVELCNAIKKRSAGGLVNGVLRAILRDGAAIPPCKGNEIDKMSVLYSIPQPLLQKLVENYGREKVQHMLKETLYAAPLYIRVNTLRTDSKSLRNILELEGVKVRPGALPDSLILQGSGAIETLPSFKNGLFHVQDIQSQRAALFLQAASGMRVLDVCAAPGGKSFTIAQTMQGQGTIISCDIHPHKIELIRQGAARLGLDLIIPKVQDATEINEEYTNFDRILCDVPCSGWGIIRRKPEIKYKALETVENLPQLQYKILENSAHYLKAGGVLAYTTCTLSPAENEQVIERFLQEHEEFEAYEQEGLQGYRRTFMPGEGEGDGFFIATVQKKRDF